MIPSSVEENTLRKLGALAIFESEYWRKTLYRKHWFGFLIRSSDRKPSSELIFDTSFTNLSSSPIGAIGSSINGLESSNDSTQVLIPE